MNEFQYLKRKQLDDRLEPLRTKDFREVPAGGWAKTVRTALGMPAEVLGKRIGIGQSAVSQLEASETAETITLASLKKLGEGLECDLVYALVPRTGLNEMMKRQALNRATKIVGSVSDSMALEAQAVRKEDQQLQINLMAQDFLTRPSTGLWDEL